MFYSIDIATPRDSNNKQTIAHKTNYSRQTYEYHFGDDCSVRVPSVPGKERKPERLVIPQVSQTFIRCTSHIPSFRRQIRRNSSA